MNQALELFYYIFSKALNFLFDSYIFDGVSLGMLCILTFAFVVLFSSLLSLPRFIRVRPSREYPAPVKNISIVKFYGGKSDD